MNEDILKGKWHELKGGVKAKWGKLTDDDLISMDGKVENLVALLQEKYGYSKEQAEEEYKGFINIDKNVSRLERSQVSGES